MNKNCLFPLLIATLFVQNSYSQEADFEEYLIERPEQVYQYNETGVRRLPLKVGQPNNYVLPRTGSPKIPIILVQFQDRKFEVSGKTDEEVVKSFQLFFNGKNNNEVQSATRSTGSVYNYFKDQSLGQFTPEFEIFGPVTLSESYIEYGKNGNDYDSNIYSFYKEAVSKIVSEKQVDWNIFDNNADGKVDMVFFIHAGWGENVVSKYDPDAIWAKEGISQLTLSLNDEKNITFGCFGVCAEARPKKKSQIPDDIASGLYGPTGYNVNNLMMDGIGVCVHEVSHALGLPDMYDTKSNTNFGMDQWSIMDYGLYINNGLTPANYNAYEREYVGWQNLVELTDTCVIKLPCFADGGVGYRITNPNNPDEFYILENRQPKGWDEKLCFYGKGLQVTHVDYELPIWAANTINVNPNHQHVTIIPANNAYVGAGTATSIADYRANISGNLFPYTQPTQSLTDTSSPSAMVYAGGTMHKPIYDITQNEDGTVTFYFLKDKASYEKESADFISSIKEGEYVDVYDLRGMHICKCKVNEISHTTFGRGVYLLKPADAPARKVLLK